MNRPGPGQHPMRNISGFPNQPQPQARATNPSLASGRLPNGKLGPGGNWNFGVLMNGAPGIQNRSLNNMGAFARGMGASQSSTPLDPSEFPSLSGGAQQPQSPNPSQAIWANASHRATQQAMLQRQNQNAVTQAPSRLSQTQTNQTLTSSQTPHDDIFSSTPQFTSQLDDFRNGGQGINSHLSGNSQLQTGNVEEFPPLNRNAATEMDAERQYGMLPSGPFSNYSSFMNINQAGVGPGVISSHQDQNGVLSQEKESPKSTRSESYPDQQGQQVQGSQRPSGSLSGEPHDASASGHASESKANQMSDQDRFGLAGLLGMIYGENSDVSGLALGQDLMSLGLDLNQPEPLYPTFASPFVTSNLAIPLQLDYSLPSCYSVTNVQPLENRISGFSDETLFYIFYSMPRDFMQEIVAEELMSRKWRYHKLERAWLTRDEAFPNPVEIERGVSERGVYLWWDASTWKKIRRDYILRYCDLDNHLEIGRSFVQKMDFPLTV